MAIETRLTTKTPDGASPYNLAPDQALRAAKALVSHLKTEQQRLETSGKKNLLTSGADSSEEDAEDETPIWLILGTKKHILDKKRLKPSKIALPHSISSPATRICLITADPQRPYKDLIADPSFPTSISSRIARVIGISKLKLKYKSYESRRQLFAEYDVFLADDRIVTSMPLILGKIFYKTTAKRPVPVNLTAGVKSWKDGEGNKVKSTRENEKAVGTPAAVAREIETALSAALVHLSPSVSTAVRVAKGNMAPEAIAENVEAVVKTLTEKFVPKGWRGVRSFHIKTPTSTALPIWLADELWVDDEDVLEEKWKPAEAPKNKVNETKRKWEEWEDELLDDEDKPVRKVKKTREVIAEEDSVAKEVKLRKERLRKQKEEAIKAIEGPPIKGAEMTEKKKSKRSKVVAA
ncbi:ribosomal protein L1 [Lepidopterella palustris CBS 459.81]|uniref:Ribosomal protein L1 n=1 Tax=Lepidopterella palustris CBS 459.81 TaxID=1314670 RepID=A0A8E2EGS6_9PEZI|nr:ribosomal protein L1 [Lepidopterella palustris CBS 459.81]